MLVLSVSALTLKYIQRLRREVKFWKDLKHENIVQMLDTIEYSCCVGMVSLWMETGDLHSFIRPDIPLSRRLEIARVMRNNVLQIIG